MLWYKGWLETRIKLLMVSGAMLFLLNTVRLAPATGTKFLPVLGAILFGNNICVALACVWLAGAGIVTQPAFQTMKGIHGSTLFTLSLPVSRLRLLAVRASLGWLLMAGSITFLCCGMWVMSPALRMMATPAEMFEYGGTLLAVASAFYFWCVLLATFLEDMWRIFGGMISFMMFRWIFKRARVPAFADIYGAIGDYSPLIKHAVFWGPITCSIGLSVFFILLALRIAQVREY